jgi:hypothetical protein
VDTGLLRELRAHERQAAQELGQWMEKSDTSLKWSGALEDLSPAQLAKVMDQMAQIAFGGDSKLIEAAKREAKAEVLSVLARPLQ